MLALSHAHRVNVMSNLFAYELLHANINYLISNAKSHIHIHNLKMIMIQLKLIFCFCFCSFCLYVLSVIHNQVLGKIMKKIYITHARFTYFVQFRVMINLGSYDVRWCHKNHSIIIDIYLSSFSEINLNHNVVFKANWDTWLGYNACTDTLMNTSSQQFIT